MLRELQRKGDLVTNGGGRLSKGRILVSSAVNGEGSFEALGERAAQCEARLRRRSGRGRRHSALSEEERFALLKYCIGWRKKGVGSLEGVFVDFVCRRQRRASAGQDWADSTKMNPIEWETVLALD